jgi:hypothetical protein
VICGPNCIRGWNFCRKLSQYTYSSMCRPYAACVNIWYLKCWHLNNKKHEWALLVTTSIWLMKTTNFLTTKSHRMKHDVSYIIHKQNSSLLNGNHHHRRLHHLEAKNSKSTGKQNVLLDFFWYYQWIVHYEFIPEGKTVNKYWRLKLWINTEG